VGVQRLSGILLVALCGVLISGCAPQPTSDATPTPTFTSDADAFAAAEATYRAYVDALNQVDLADPETFEAVYAWTTGDASAAARELFSWMHADNQVVSGDSRITAIASTSGARANAVSLDVCVDVSEVDVRDESGETVVAPDRVDVQKMRLEFARSRTETGLSISNITGRADGPAC